MANSLNVLIDELSYQEESLSKLEKEIKLSCESGIFAMQSCWNQPGISLNSAWYGLLNWEKKRFKSLDQLCNLSALLRLPILREKRKSRQDLKTWKLLSQAILIESSWVAVKKDPAMLAAQKFCRNERQ